MIEAILKKYFVPIFFILNLLLFYIIFYNGAVSSTTTNYYQVFNELEEDIITASASDEQPTQELFPQKTTNTTTTSTTTTTALPITVQKQSDFQQVMKKRMSDKERGCNAVYPQHSRLHTPSLERQVYYVWVDNDYYVVSSWIRQHNALLYKIYC